MSPIRAVGKTRTGSALSAGVLRAAGYPARVVVVWQRFIAHVQRATTRVGPEGIKIDFPEVKEVKMNWKQFTVPIDYGNLPLQEAIHFVSSMVMTQASKARFATGIATVGGRTHIGVITKEKGFVLLDEPKLAHRYTGFVDDV